VSLGTPQKAIKLEKGCFILNKNQKNASTIYADINKFEHIKLKTFIQLCKTRHIAIQLLCLQKLVNILLNINLLKIQKFWFPEIKSQLYKNNINVKTIYFSGVE
jgi:hypothetical protein